MSTLVDILRGSAEKFPHKTALIYNDTRYTYTQLSSAVAQACSFFVQHIQPGDRVALFLDNSDQFVIAYFAILQAGGVCQPINLRTSGERMKYQVEFAQTHLIVTSKKYISKVNGLGLPETVKVMDVSQVLKKTKTQLLGPAVLSDSYCTLMYTSGTTGNSKAILLKHQIVYQATTNIIEYLKLRSDDIYYQILPLTHSFGLGNLHSTFAVGGTVIISTRVLNYKAVLSEMVQYKVTFFAAVPATIKLMVDHFLPQFQKVDKYLRILCTNTGPMPVGTTQTILSSTKNMQFFTYYGLTEASRSTFMYYNLYPTKLTSVGKPAPNVEIRLLDEHGHWIQTSHTIGQICIKGKHTIDAYWKNDEANRSKFIDGYMNTGDVGYLDEDGFLFVTGRTDDLVNAGGEKFSLQEVDTVIGQLPFVQDVVCIAVSHPVLEVVVHAHVVLRQDTTATHKQAEREILAQCKRVLDSFKIPQKIFFRDSIMKTESGKVQRKLFAQAIQKYDKSNS